jgi:hypothetical protein
MHNKKSGVKTGSVSRKLRTVCVLEYLNGSIDEGHLQGIIVVRERNRKYSHYFP